MTAAFAVAIGVLMLFAFSAFVIYEKRTSAREADQTLAQGIQDIRHELATGEHSLKNLTEFMEEEGNEMHERNLVLQVVDANGKIISQSQQRAPQWPLKGDSWRAVTLQSGEYTIVLSLHWAKTLRQLRVLTLGLIVLGMFMTAAAAAGAWIVVGNTLSPIGSLSRQAHAASVESLIIHLHAPSEDAEVIELVDTLNGLLLRIAETAASRGRFYAAASHELRTPLQALSGHLEVGLSRQRSAEEYRQSLAEAQEQTNRLTSLVQELLLLNQLELMTSSPPQEAVNLADICERVLAYLQRSIEERDLKVSVDLPDFTFMAPLVHTEMILRNLIENAVKYASPGGEVRITVTPENAAPVVEIFNQSLPIAGWTPDRYFEPFFRPDSSRNSSTGGNGLGLAICKAIAHANGWEITLTQEAGGVRAKVILSSSVRTS